MLKKTGAQQHQSRPIRPSTKRSLSPNQNRLLERMQRLGFGTICGLHVRSGEPQFEPPFQVKRMVRLSGNNSPRPESALTDFVLKKEQENFFEELHAIGDAVIDILKVCDGLPISFEIREAM
jgi:hypothetical protein